MKAFVAGALAPVLFAAFGSAEAQTSPHPLPPAPAHIARLTLPAGPLRMVAGSPKSVAFIDETRPFKREGNYAVGVLYSFDQPGIPSRGDVIVQVVQLERIDCVARTYQALGVQGFNAADKFVIWAYDERPYPVSEGPMWEGLANYVCNGGSVQAKVFETRAAAVQAAKEYISARR